MQDVRSLEAGIDALRPFDGEKHLVFMTPVGVEFGELGYVRQLARLASDARVVIDVIHTDGVVLPYTKVEEALLLTRMTGGRFDINRNRWAAKDLDLINWDTNFKYVLGYRPSNPNLDGRFRNIKVTVKRRDLKVVNRTGYVARDPASPDTVRQTTSYARIVSAAHDITEVADLNFRATAVQTSAREVRLDLIVDVSRLAFDTTATGRHVSSFELAAFVLDKRQRPVGQIWKTVNAEFGDATLEDAKRAGGAPITITVPVTGEADSVKLVGYHYAGDLVGTRNVFLPRKPKR